MTAPVPLVFYSILTPACTNSTNLICSIFFREDNSEPGRAKLNAPNFLHVSRPLSGSAGSKARRASRLRAGIGNLNRRPAARSQSVQVPAVGPPGNIGRLLLVP